MALVQYAQVFQENGPDESGTFNTRPGSPSFQALRILSETIEGGPELTDETDAENPMMVTGFDSSGKSYAGPINMKCRVDEQGELLLGLFGKVSTSQPDTANAASAYDHVYTPLEDLTATAPSLGLDLGIEKKQGYQFSGMLCDVLTITKTQAGEVNLTYDIVTADRSEVTFDTGKSPTYSTKSKLQTVGTSTVFGTSVDWIDLSIILRRNWRRDKDSSGNVLPSAEIGEWAAEVSGTFKFQTKPNSNSLINNLENGNEGELTIQFKGTNIGGSVDEQLKIEMDRIRIKSVSGPHINGTERKVENFNATVAKPSSGDFCKVTLTNENSTPSTFN